MRADAPPNATYAVRVQNVVAGGPPVTVPSLAEALGLPNMTACSETTLSLQQARAANEAVRLRWRAQRDKPDAAAPARAPADAAADCNGPIALGSLDLRTFSFAVS